MLEEGYLCQVFLQYFLPVSYTHLMPEDPDAGIVIEVKYAKEMKELDAACETAMAQIKNKRYDEALRRCV